MLPRSQAGLAGLDLNWCISTGRTACSLRTYLFENTEVNRIFRSVKNAQLIHHSTFPRSCAPSISMRTSSKCAARTISFPSLHLFVPHSFLIYHAIPLPSPPSLHRWCCPTVSALCGFVLAWAQHLYTTFMLTSLITLVAAHYKVEYVRIFI
jgi:hypothetical protein